MGVEAQPYPNPSPIVTISSSKNIQPLFPASANMMHAIEVKGNPKVKLCPASEIIGALQNSVCAQCCARV